MREHCTPDIQIKASGGIRTINEVLAAIEAGATRVGLSATEDILK
jgi:deoxyribose-phosphate aldolase